MKNCLAVKMLRQTFRGIAFRSHNVRFWCFLLISVFLMSCSPSYLRPAQTELTPTGDKALVRFISPKAVGYIFDSEELIGYAFPRTQFD